MKRGFTFIELLISLAVLALILGAGWFSFSGYAVRQELISAAAQVGALIAEAQAKTRAGEGGAAWGVHIEETRATLFRAPSYQQGNTENKVEVVPPRIAISSIDFQNNEVIFKRLTGAAESAGFIILSVRGKPSLSKTISVNALGTIEGE